MILLTVVAMIGTTVYFIYSIDNKTQLFSSTSTQKIPKTISNNSTKSPSLINPAQKYLVIAEWGVKLPLNSIVSDSYIVASNSGVGFDGKHNFYISVTHLIESGCNANNNNLGQPGAIGLFSHSPVGQKDPVSGELITSEYPYGTILDNVYYYYEDKSSGLNCTNSFDLRKITVAFETLAQHITIN